MTGPPLGAFSISAILCGQEAVSRCSGLVKAGFSVPSAATRIDSRGGEETNRIQFLSVSAPLRLCARHGPCESREMVDGVHPTAVARPWVPSVCPLAASPLRPAQAPSGPSGPATSEPLR